MYIHYVTSGILTCQIQEYQIAAFKNNEVVRGEMRIVEERRDEGRRDEERRDEER